MSESNKMQEIIIKHSQLLVQFRERLSDLQLEPYRKSDAYLINWLICTGFELKKSEALLRASLKWREQNNMDHILEEFLDMDHVLPYEYLGEDKGGRPFLKAPLGLWKLREAVESGKRDQALRHLFGLCETIDNACKVSFYKSNQTKTSESPPVNQFTAILDFKGLSFYQMASPKCIKLMIELVEAAEGNYPNMPYKLVLLNVQWVCRLLLKIISPFLSTATLSTVKMLGSNTEEWKQELLKLVDPEDLPVEYGGNKFSNKHLKN